MKTRALFSKSLVRRSEFISEIAENATGAVIHLHPAKLDHADIHGVYRTTFESINKTDVWLHINSLAGPSTTVILECPTRYPKITSPKFQHLQILSHRCGNVYIADIVPFTKSIEYVYTTCAYLGREILGYPHYYAWRENYQEIDDGTVKSAHDFGVVSSKLSPHCAIDYPEFTESKRQRIDFKLLDSERDEYANAKSELFSTEISANKIITNLADIDHAQESRVGAVLSAIDGQSDTYIYCNLSSYAAKLNKAIKKSGLKAKATSYALGRESDAETIIYAEPPIVKSYLLLDAEARSQPDKTIHIVGDHGVSKYLQSQLDKELHDIDGLTRAIAKQQKNIHPDRCIDRSEEANRDYIR